MANSRHFQSSMSLLDQKSPDNNVLLIFKLSNDQQKVWQNPKLKLEANHKETKLI